MSFLDYLSSRYGYHYPLILIVNLRDKQMKISKHDEAKTT